MSINSLEFRKLAPDMESGLVAFFDLILVEGDDQFFHPHSFNRESAHAISHYTGKDQYVVIILNEEIVGYGMLRGWDDGYEIPSLGMIIGKALRGRGVGYSFIQYLHALALLAGAERIRLTVCKNNEGAIRLYEKVGYRLSEENDDTLVGYWPAGS